MKEGNIERINILLGLSYFIHERIYRECRNGYILRKKALLVIRRNHNIPKDECPIVLESLKQLGLISKEGKYLKVKKPKKSREALVLEFKKKLGMV